MGVGVIGTSDLNPGVQGESANSDGVIGPSNGANASGVFGSNTSSSGFGVFGNGLTASTLGVYGQNGGLESSTGIRLKGAFGPGVWGDGGTVSRQIAVLGTVDDGPAGYFNNNSPSGETTFYVEADNSGSFPFYAVNDATSGACDIDPSGNLNCTGPKNAVVPITAASASWPCRLSNRFFQTKAAFTHSHSKF